MTYSRAALLFLFTLSGCSFKAPEDRIRFYSKAEPGFMIMSNPIKFAHLQAAQPETWQARARLQISVCLARTFGPRTMEPGVSFKVELSDDEKGTGRGKVYETLAGGCFEFEPTVTYPYAQKTVRYLKKYLIIRGLHAELEGLARIKPVYIDPWNQQALADWNEVENGAPEATDIGPLQLRVQGLTLNKISTRQPVVDQVLRMSFRIPYTLSFSDHYTRLGSLSTPTTDAVSPGTHFDVTGALLAPPFKQVELTAENLTGYRELAGFHVTAISDINGTVTSEIVLQIDLADVPLLDSRTRMVLDIRPLAGAGEAPQPVSLILSFDPRLEQMTYPPEVSPISAHTILNKSPLRAESLSKSLSVLVNAPSSQTNPLGQALLEGGAGPDLQRFDLTSEELDLPLGISTEDVTEVLKGPSVPVKFLEHFANLYSSVDDGFPGLSESSARSLFLRMPEQFVRWSKFTVIEAVEPLPLQIKADSQTLGVAANIFKQTTSNSVQGDGRRDGVGAESNELRGLGFNSFGTGRTWNWVFSGRQDQYSMREVSTIDSVMAQDGLTRIENFYADRMRVSLKGKFKDCLLLKFLDASSGEFLFCAPRSALLEESYFFVTDESRSNVFSFLDYKNLAERQLVKLFRGEEVFNHFKDVLSDSHLNFRLEPASGLPDLSSLPGISNFHQSTPVASGSDQLRHLVDQMMVGFGGEPPIRADQLLAYFTVAQQRPQQIFDSEVGQRDFLRLSQRLLASPRVDRPSYFMILKVLHAHLRQLGNFKAADWLLHFASQVSQK